MAIDNISMLIQAAAAYEKVNNRPSVASNEDIGGSVDFQKMVNVEFNRFSSMTPDQILRHVNSIKSGESLAIDNAAGDSSIARTIFSDARKKISKQETVTTKSLIHEASLVDLVTSTAEARNTLRTMVTVRDRLFEAWERVLNMQI